MWKKRGVIPLLTASSIYQVPLILEEWGLGKLIVERLGLPDAEPNLIEWRELVAQIAEPKNRIRVAVVGKYVELPDAYMSVREALYHAGVYNHRVVEIDLDFCREDLERNKGFERLMQADGIVVPGGFGERGIEGKNY